MSIMEDVYEQLLNFPKQWFLNVLDAINDGVLVVDRELIIRYVNPEYLRITGTRREEIINCNLTVVRPGAMLPQVISTKKSLSGVYRREGDIEYVVDMAPILINGKVNGGVSIVKDITEVQRMGEELRKFNRNASRLKSMVDSIYRAKYRVEDIIGESTAIRETIHLAKKLSHGDADILINGESGTGKEVFAQAIHNASRRKQGPFVAVNCAAIAPTLIESELFGYDEGAFTGAKKGGKVGLFEIADGGTLFLDEVAELSMEVQAKLLRVLQERSIRRVGETAEVAVDIRVIAATNKDLKKMVGEEKYRADLYYRLNILNLTLPPLRQRITDVGLLVNEFLRLQEKKFCRKFSIDQDVIQIFSQYPWPGNVRELRNVIEYTTNMCENDKITVESLPQWLRSNHEPFVNKSLGHMVLEFERKVIQDMLECIGSDVEAKRKIAKQLGISVATLYNKLK